MWAKEDWPPNPELVHLLEEAIKNTTVTREQVNTLCSIAIHSDSQSFMLILVSISNKQMISLPII